MTRFLPRLKGVEIGKTTGRKSLNDPLGYERRPETAEEKLLERSLEMNWRNIRSKQIAKAIEVGFNGIVVSGNDPRKWALFSSSWLFSGLILKFMAGDFFPLRI